MKNSAAEEDSSGEVDDSLSSTSSFLVDKIINKTFAEKNFDEKNFAEKRNVDLSEDGKNSFYSRWNKSKCKKKKKTRLRITQFIQN